MKLEIYLDVTKKSRSEFAKNLGVTEASLCRYINGDRMPRPFLLKKIAVTTDGAVMPNDFIDINVLEILKNKKGRAA